MRRALIDGTTTGLAKFLCDGRGRLIGAHILGEAAPEVIHEAQVIKASKKPLQKLNLVTHGYPTYAQALVGRASQLSFLDRMGGNAFVKTALRLYPGLKNRLSLARDRLAETHPVPAENKTARIHVVVEAETKPPTEIGINARYIGGKVCIIDLPEDLMDHDERPLMAASIWDEARNPESLVLDCSRIRRMNGLGASMLVKLSARATMKGQNLSAFGVSEELRRILAVTDLDKAISIHKSETEALRAAGVSADQSSAEDGPKSDILINLANWAIPVSELFVPPMPEEARNLNVNGRRAVGPIMGFGRLCQKIFRLRVSDPSISSETAIAVLKENFPAFQPPFNRFYASSEGIKPGEIVLIDSMTPGGPVSTGVMILYADERSFTFNTPQGHPECGFVSFSAHETHEGTVVRILGMARAGDPIYEAAFRLAGSHIQTRIWTHVLTSLALHFGIPAEITVEEDCIDTRLHWSQIGNLFFNAQIRTLINEPKRWFRFG
jgi:anti-anti-sigma factor